MTTITVTQEDIDLGEAANCCLCPIARATRRAFKARTVNVTGRLYVYFKPTSLENLNPLSIYALPPEAEQFVADFDNGKGVEPFEFEVDETKPLN